MGARISILRYVQAFVLHNALGETLKPSAASLAIGTRTPQGVTAILHRLAIVDPGIKFTIIDRELAQAQQHIEAKANIADSFHIFCDANSIMIDEERFLRCLKLAIGTPVPELSALYRLRGQRNAEAEKPLANDRSSAPVISTRSREKAVHTANKDVEIRKAAALGWQDTFAEIVPRTSARLRTKLAWRLANLHVDTKESFASMQPETLVHTSTNPSAFVKLREQYFRALPRYMALKQAVMKRAAEHST